MDTPPQDEPIPATGFGYLLYCLILFLPVATVRFGYHTLFAIEFRRAAVWGLVALGGAILLVVRGKFVRRRHPLHRPLLLFLGATVVTTVFSRLPLLSVETAVFFLLGGFLYYIGAYCVDLDRDLPRIGGAIAFSTTWVAAYSIGQHFGFNPLELIAEGESHNSATFVTRNLLAAYLLFGLIHLGHGLMRETRVVLLVLYLIGSLIVATAVALSMTIGAWLALAGALVAYLVLTWLLARRGHGDIPMWRAAAVAIVGVLAVASVVGVELRKSESSKLRFKDKLTDIATGKHRSVRERWVMMKIARRILIDNLVVGSGPGTFGIARGKYERDYLGQPRYLDIAGLSEWTHNDVLQVSAEMGGLGLLTYGWLLVAGLILPIRMLRKKDATRAHLARLLPYWCGWLGLTLHGMVHFTLYAPAAAFYWWLSLGLVAAVDIGPNSKEFAKGGGGRKVLKIAVIVAGIALPVYMMSQFTARYQQAKGFEFRRIAEYLDAKIIPIHRKWEVYKRAGNHAEAKKLYTEAEVLRLSSLEFRDRAQKAYDRSVAIRPWSNKLWAQIGDFRRLQQQHEEALKAYATGLRYAPDDHVLHYATAVIHLELRQLDEADRFALQAIELRPNYSPSHVMRGLIEVFRARRDGPPKPDDVHLDRALDFFRRAREVNDSEPDPYRWAAVTLFMQNRPGRAMHVLQEGLDRVASGKEQELAYMMAWFMLLLGMPDKAAQLGGFLDSVYGIGKKVKAIAEREKQRQDSEILLLTVHELHQLTGHLVRGLGTPRIPILVAAKKRIDEQYAQFGESLSRSLKLALEGEAAKSEVEAVRAVDLLGTKSGIHAELMSALKWISEQPEEKPVGRAFRAAALRATGQLPAIRDSLRGGSLFGKKPAEAQAWRTDVRERLNRLSIRPRSLRELSKMVGPLYLDELQLLRNQMAVMDAELGKSRRTQDQVIGHDILLLTIDALVTVKRYDEAEPLLTELGRITFPRTLQPPWAAAPFRTADPAARRHFSRHRPDIALVARVKQAELKLLRGKPREAADEAAALFDWMQKNDLLHTTPLDGSLTGLPDAKRVLAERTRDTTPGRMALHLVTLGLLAAGDAKAAADNEARFEKAFHEHKARLPLADPDQLERQLRELFGSY